jgi:hypothetical protein
MKILILLSANIFLFLLSCGNNGSNQIQNETHKSNQRDSLTVSQDYLVDKGFELMVKESIGEIKCGLSREKIESIFGKPYITSVPVISELDGQLYENVEYTQKGISITYLVKQDSSRVVATYELWDFCNLQTSRNIGFDNSYEEVIKAYKGLINPIGSDSETVVVGSIYGGIVFSFERGKMIRIFVGESAD